MLPTCYSGFCRLSDGPEMDFVFVDGPHTYANVRNEPRLIALQAVMKPFFSLQPFLLFY